MQEFPNNQPPAPVISIHQAITVAFDYPVIFTCDLFAPDNPVLANTIDRHDENRRHRVLAVVDGGVAAASPDLPARISAYADSYPDCLDLVAEPLVVPGGETMKNDYRKLMEVVDMMLEFRLCRHSFVIVVGGGAVLDSVGFSAGIVHRGLRTVRVPTTVLAQNDAGIGIKNAMNLHGGKNTVGVFSPPFAVLNDFSLLRTLDDRDWIAGVAEAFKVALIRDAAFFFELCQLAPQLRRRDEHAMKRLILRCVELHLEHLRTSGDPFELGSMRPLDFGHWAAHYLESMTGYTLRHGEAVAIGLALDCLYAQRRGWLAKGETDAVLEALAACGLPLWHPALTRRLGDGRLEVLQGIEAFREHLGGRLTVTFPEGLGSSREVHCLDEQDVEWAAERLEAEFRPVKEAKGQ